MLAVRDTEVMITITQLCDNLFIPMDSEKEVIELSFNRESTLEKNLEKARNLSKKHKEDKGDDAEDEEMRKRLEAIGKEFFEKPSDNQ